MNKSPVDQILMKDQQADAPGLTHETGGSNHIFFRIFMNKENCIKGSLTLHKTYLKRMQILIIGSGGEIFSMPGDLNFHGINADHTWYIGR